jgi:hypothetical protein
MIIILLLIVLSMAKKPLPVIVILVLIADDIKEGLTDSTKGVNEVSYIKEKVETIPSI